MKYNYAQIYSVKSDIIPTRDNEHSHWKKNRKQDWNRLENSIEIIIEAYKNIQIYWNRRSICQ